MPDALREAAVRLHYGVIMTSLSPDYRLITTQSPPDDHLITTPSRPNASQENLIADEAQRLGAPPSYEDLATAREAAAAEV